MLLLAKKLAIISYHFAYLSEFIVVKLKILIIVIKEDSSVLSSFLSYIVFVLSVVASC